jgi:hypothetical protein
MSQTVDQDLRFINESIRAVEPGWDLEAPFEEVLRYLLEGAADGWSSLFFQDLLLKGGEPTPTSLAHHIRTEVGGGPDWPRKLHPVAPDDMTFDPYSPPRSP